MYSFFDVEPSVFIENYVDFSTTVSLYHHSFCPDMQFFVTENQAPVSLEKQADCQPRMDELYRGVRGHAPPEKKLKIELLETPYPIFPGSNAITSYVHFVALFLESRY